MMKAKTAYFLQIFVLLTLTQSGFTQCWTTQNSGTTSYLSDVFFVDNQQGWVVGASGTILHTTDGGGNWSSQTSGTTSMITGLFFLDANAGWATMSQGDILHTTNGGNSWNIQTTPTTESLEAIYFTDGNNGWAVGACGTLLSTTNGGANWALHANHGLIEASLTAIDLSDQIGLITASNASMLRTTDGGQNWSVINPGHSIGFLDMARQGSKVIAVGKTVWQSEDAGENWTQVTNLNQSEPTWYSIAAFSNSEWLMGGNSGSAAYTSDSGNAWSSQVNEDSLTITAISPHGFAVGANGKIWKYGCEPIIPEMILVEGGTFTRGCTEEQEADCLSSERPAHEVTVNSFYIGKYEVTQGEWESLMGENPSGFGDCGSNCPVERVSWYDVVVYCNRLSEQAGLTPCYYSDDGYTNVYGKSGQTWSLPNAGEVYWLATANGYRLPTEAEWEYAARGGMQSEGYKYAGGNDESAVAWYEDNSSDSTQAVGGKAPNELGLFDMSGNVWERCWDWYDSDYYNESVRCQPPGPNSGSDRVIRGGSWGNAPAFLRCAFRGYGTPGDGSYTLGFRVARGAIDPNFCSTLCRTTDSLALVEFYNATNGPNWSNTWNLNQPINTWYGVTLDSNGCLSQVDVSNNNLSGCFPDTLRAYCENTFITDDNPLLPWQGDFSQFCAGETQIGAPCDDGDPFTTNDVIKGNCSCEGSLLTGTVPEMILVEGGTFTRGCTSEQEPDCFSDESPAHEVTLNRFNLGKYEITQKEWTSLMGTNPSNFNACGDSCPVEQVSWYDIIVYCNRLSEQEGLMPCYYSDNEFTNVYGKSGQTWSLPNAGEVYWLATTNGYRLPTEAEWEYAARGGMQSERYKFAGGNDISAVAWYSDNSSSSTHAVGGKASNELGVFDMTGNVWEWCWDWYGSYSDSAQCQPQGPNSGTTRVLRGGSWSNLVQNCRVSNRTSNPRGNRFNYCGFRIARGVIDSSFCSTCTFTINPNPFTPSCKGVNDGSVTLIPVNGTGPYTYAWNNGNTSDSGNGLTISNLTAGTYEIIITDTDNGCRDTITEVLADGIQVEVSCEVSQAITRVGGNDGNVLVSISSGTAPFQIAWSGPVSGNSPVAQLGDKAIEGLGAGSYQVTVTDTNGCEANCSFTLSDPDCTLSVSGNATAPKCSGGNDGVIALTPSNGTGPYTYAWNNGNTSDTGNGLTLSDLSAGTYEIIVTDTDNGCRDTLTEVLSDGVMVEISCNVTQAISMVDGNDGIVSVSISSGTAPFQIAWSGPVSGNSPVAQLGDKAIEGLGAGSYQITVTDTNGCEANCSFTLSDPDCTLSVSGNATAPKCSGGNDGVIALTPSNGTGPYTYVWNNGNASDTGNGLTLSDLSAGTYEIILTDTNNGCRDTLTEVLSDGVMVDISCNVTQVISMVDGNDGIVSVSISSGTAPFQIAWSGPVSGNSPVAQLGDKAIEDLEAGSYQVTVTDTNGCESNCSFTLSDPDCTLSVSGNATAPKCSRGNDGVIALTPANGTGPYTYAWNNGNASDTGNGLTLSDLSAGTYEIILTDTNSGCQDSVSVTVDMGNSPTLTCSESSPVTIANQNNGVASINITGGLAPFTVSWSGPTNDQQNNLAFGNHLIENLGAGTYSFVVTDANGCTDNCSLEITRNIDDPCVDNPVMRPQPTNPRVTYCPGESIPELSVRTEAGFQYNWYNPQGDLIQANSPTLTVLQPGFYYVEAQRNSDNCKSVDRTAIEVVSLPSISIQVDQTVCLEGEPDTYFLQLTILNATEVTTNIGQFTRSENSYTFVGLPLDQALEVTASNEEGCIVQKTIPIPNCNCPDIEAPVIARPQVFYCPSDESIALEASVPNTQTVHWYTVVSGGTRVGEGLRFRPELQGQYFAEAVDLNAGCTSASRTSAVFFPQAEPLVRDIDKFCNADETTYTLLLEIVNGENITNTAGRLEERGQNRFAVTNVPIDSSVTVNASISISNCTTTFTAAPPLCQCDSLPAPIILDAELSNGNPIIRYCSKAEKPLLRAESPLGTSVNWYTAPQGGELLAAKTRTFKPKGSGNYYLETVSPDGRCISRERSGVIVEEVYQPFSDTIVFICNLDSIGTSDTLFYPHSFGCDSLAITTYRFDEMITELVDTQYVCSVQDTGRTEGYEVIDGCPARVKTIKLFFEDMESAFVIGDTIDNCGQLEMITLRAKTPSNSEGEWRSLDTSSDDLSAPFDTITEVNFLRPGWNRFVWSLSNAFCIDFAQDTISIWNPEPVVANDVAFDQVDPGTRIESNLLANDEFIPTGYTFTPFGYPEDPPTPSFTTDENTKKKTGKFSFISNEPMILNFQYELCDHRCFNEPVFCDTAEIKALICSESLDDAEFDNGFDPYLGSEEELFDPVKNLQELTCDFDFKEESASFVVYDLLGTVVFESTPYRPWNGRFQNSGSLLPINQYIWILSIKFTLGEVEGSKVWTGSVLIFHN